MRLSLVALLTPALILAVLTVPSLVELSLLTLASWFSRSKRMTPVGSWPRLAVVIPAHNEEILVQRTVESARRMSYGGVLKIFVVADNCTDATAALAAASGAEIIVREDPLLRGKGHALNFAFSRLLSEPFDAFMVLDADSVVSTAAAEEIGRRISCGADAIQIRYEVGNAEDSQHTCLVSMGFLAMNVIRLRGRSTLGFSSGIVGNGFALTRETLEKVPYTAFSIVEDLEYHLRLVQAGRLVEYVDSVKVLGEIPSNRTDSVEQRARWEGGRLQVASTCLPGLLGGILRGHLRLIEPALDLLTLPLGFLVGILLSLLLVPFGQVRMFASIGIGIVFLHVASAGFVCANPWRLLYSLTLVPSYLFWKLTTVSIIRRKASQHTAWVRASRGELGRGH